MQLTVAFDAFTPVARWGELFHVLRLERPDLSLAWRPAGFPRRDRPLLDATDDAALFVAPPPEEGLSAVTLDESRMVVVLAVGHPLATNHELRVADILGAPFPGGADLRPDWRAFWTLDCRRGGPPELVDDVSDAREGLEVVVSGRAIGTVPSWAAGALAHPGVVALPLADAPAVPTKLLWRSADDRDAVRGLVELARAWTKPLGRRFER